MNVYIRLGIVKGRKLPYSSNYEVYHNVLSLGHHKWHSKRLNLSLKRPKTRLPPFPLFVYYVCRGILCYAATGRRKQIVPWLKIWQQYADDSLVFTRVLVKHCQHLKLIFDCYTAASGQLFNYNKSSMFLVAIQTDEASRQ